VGRVLVLRSDVVFLEYVFNPDAEGDNITARLKNLGYHCRSRHANNLVEVWTQKNSIFLVRKDNTLQKPSGVYGVGILTEKHPMDIVNDCALDNDTEFFMYEDDNGFRVYFIEDKELTNSYVEVDFSTNNSAGLHATSGAILQTTSVELCEVFSKLCKKVESSDKYTKFIFHNNFVVFQENINSDKVIKIITETADVFQTTSTLTINGVDLLEFDDVNAEGFGKLAHKITGYNCRAFGNQSSYSIENYVPAKELNVDIIFRTRKQYLKIQEHTLDFYEQFATN